ncbi:hypothetical protein L0128_14365, partial [candidate division KSB1 bacterium]|nr:hypothetical protein [candidate division KSB1 bacterium]
QSDRPTDPAAFAQGAIDDIRIYNYALTEPEIRALNNMPDPVLTRIEVMPATVVLQPGQSMQFNANGYDQYGNEFTITPIWSATGGTITATGLYTATTIGEFAVFASNPDSTIAGKAIIHNLAKLAQIQITPAEISLQVGQAYQFVASGKNAYDVEIPFTPRWFVTGGVINATGLYQATASGDFIITAANEDSSVTGVAQVQVHPTGVANNSQPVTDFSLSQNYPNPFNPTTAIRFGLPKAACVRLVIINTLGESIRTLMNGLQSAGRYEIYWDGKNEAGVVVPSGNYFYLLQTNEIREVRKMMLVK